MDSENYDSEGIRRLFEDEGIRLLLDGQVKSVSAKSGATVQVVIEQNGVKKTVDGSHLLVAAGRTPNTAGIGLELAGVQLTDRGYIKVNERLETTAEGVWRWVRLQAARSLRTSRLTILECFVTISVATITSRRADKSRFVCSRILNLPASV